MRKAFAAGSYYWQTDIFKEFNLPTLNFPIIEQPSYNNYFSGMVTIMICQY